MGVVTMRKLVIMSEKEIYRLEVIQRVIEKRLSQQDAAIQLGISERQLRRLQRAYERSGAKGLTHQRRSQASNRKLPESYLEPALKLIREKYGLSSSEIPKILP
jgi:transposase